ncbi:MAG: DUF5680 domain-containing protein [Candidatus Pacebacteria bacterium]|nr:DUF5680 domain-containing protein [Candidatus Paceibacterota bacterium]MDD5357424.1 DUF5680 domain-containing protein [Candidatus Paceibacterota bacterium]
MNLKILEGFLKRAKKNTYASESAKKAKSLRPSSKDYEYSEGLLTYHDTYFGGINFIGEEVVYAENTPQWGMNYNGYVLDSTITEAEIDKSLRGALMQEYSDLIPVRGPKLYRVEDFEYRNKINGELSRFDGREEISKNGKLIYYAVFHGGLIK